MMLGEIRPWRIRYGGPKNWQIVIRSRLDASDFDAEYGIEQNMDIKSLDAVAPLSLEDYLLLRDVDGIETKAILPSVACVDLCDDKGGLDTSLSELGFAHFSPGIQDVRSVRYPYVCKARRSFNGNGTVVIRSAADELKYWDFLGGRECIRQRYIAGNIEFCAHFLVCRGSVFYQRTVRYEMPEGVLVKGEAGAPRRARFLTTRDPFADDFVRLLSAMQYEGSVCIDYKVEDATPIIMEINPRVGSSLLRDIDGWTDALLEALGRKKRRPNLSRRWTRLRRNTSRRFRRLNQQLKGNRV
jgi:hypothetical protein